MYINPFVAGVICTILGEMLAVIAVAVYQYLKRRKQVVMMQCEKCEYVCDTPLGSYCTLTNEPLETTSCHYNDLPEYDAAEVIMFSRDQYAKLRFKGGKKGMGNAMECDNKECEYICDTPLGSYCTLTNEPVETTRCHYEEQKDLESDIFAEVSR